MIPPGARHRGAAAPRLARPRGFMELEGIGHWPQLEAAEVVNAYADSVGNSHAYLKGDGGSPAKRSGPPGAGAAEGGRWLPSRRSMCCSAATRCAREKLGAVIDEIDRWDDVTRSPTSPTQRKVDRVGLRAAAASCVEQALA